MRNFVASALMVSALALTPATVLAQSSTDQDAAQSGDSTTQQDAGQTGQGTTNQGSGQSDETTTGQSKDQVEDEMEAIDTAGERGKFLTSQQSNQTLSESYIGASVLIGSGEERESVGTISQLIFDESDAITGAVVDVGGFLGIGAKPVGLQWDTLEQVRSEQTIAFTASMTREEFENAPEFKDLEEQSGEGTEEMEEEPASQEGTTTTN